MKLLTTGVLALGLTAGVILAPAAHARELPSLVIFECQDLAKGAPRVSARMPGAYTDESPGRYSLTVWTTDGKTFLRTAQALDYSSTLHGDLADFTGPKPGEELVYMVGPGDPTDPGYVARVIDKASVRGC